MNLRPNTSGPSTSGTPSSETADQVVHSVVFSKAYKNNLMNVVNAPEVDTPAPSFSLPATGGQTISLNDQKGKKVVLYFYPRDATPGCTTESQNFRDAIDRFDSAGAIIFGISQDPMSSHEKFKTKQSLPFELLSDEEGSVCRAYDVIKLKKMYGKEFEGIERSTFLIDGNGILKKAWRKVKVPGHIDEVLAAVQAL